MKNGYIGALIFQEIECFEHLKYNFKTSWPQKNSIFKILFTSKITLISMIKKIPLTFLDVKKQTSYDLFYFYTSEAPQKWQGTISKKRRAFCWFSSNCEVEATWASLIGWPNKTSTKDSFYGPCIYKKKLAGRKTCKSDLSKSPCNIFFTNSGFQISGILFFSLSYGCA